MTENELHQSIEDLHQKVDRLLEDTQRAHARFRSVAGAASYTGLSTESIRRLIAAGKLVAYRPVRGRIVVDLRQLDALVLGSTSTPRTGRGRAHQP
jgi:excisionase family DNA binding protein